MVVVKLFKRRKGQPFTIITRYHTHCWIEQGIKSIESKPVVKSRRGRARLSLPDNAKKARVKILARRAAVMQRIREEADTPPDQRSIEKIIRLGVLLSNLRADIECYGGAPKSWK